VRFVDELEINVAAGAGGDGMVAFRHEKFMPMGGPAGGDGGRGGDIVLVASTDVNTLYDLSFRRLYRAEPGGKGGPRDLTGASAAALEVRVPVGTMAYDLESGDLLGDLATKTSRLIVARGGRGGRGNARFVNSVNRAPRMAEKGEPGEQRRIKLELKLLADVGLVGLPNAGKSTLLSVVTNAHPKIADYPFTTLVPSLGIVKHGTLPSFCIADLPGLIEGAHLGEGLGHRFLRHVERTRVLAHLIDLSQVTEGDEMRSFHVVMDELRAFSELLATKPQILVATKLDLPEARDRWSAFAAGAAELGLPAIGIASATREGLEPLLIELLRLLAATPAEADEPEVPPVSDEEPVFTYLPPFTLEPVPGGGWRVQGAEIERLTAMTDFANDEAVGRFLRMVMKMGFVDELRATVQSEDDPVFIGEMEFAAREFYG